MNIYKPARSSWEVGTASPPDEPVTAAYVRDHTALTTDDALTLLEAYITEARQLVELETNRVLMTTACTLRLDGFPPAEDAVIELPGGKVQSVDEITYVDENGATQTWASSNYTTDLLARHGNGRIGLAYGADWPAVQDRGLPVTIIYTAGWPTADDVPPALRGAIAKVAASLYDERHAEGDKALTESRWFRAMVSKWRIWKVA